MTNPKKIALVIGWGAVKCTAALGLLKVLNRENIHIDMVVAGGAGAIYGSLYALGYTPEEIVEMNEKLWTHDVTRIPNRQAILQLLFPKTVQVKDFFNLLDDQLMNQRLYDAVGDHTFADTNIPLFITATDYKTGDLVTINQGSIFEAVRASIALPLIFPPQDNNNQLLADAFLSEPLPIGVAIQEQAEIILAMGFESLTSSKRENFSDFMFHITDIMSNNLMKASTAFYSLAHHTEVISIIPKFEDEVHIFDTHKVPDMIKLGEHEGQKILPRLKELLSNDN